MNPAEKDVHATRVRLLATVRRSLTSVDRIVEANERLLAFPDHEASARQRLEEARDEWEQLQGQEEDLIEALALEWASTATEMRDRAQMASRDELAPTLETVEYINGPWAGRQEQRADTRRLITAPGGSYVRSVRCADDGARRYVWRPDQAPLSHPPAPQPGRSIPATTAR